VLPTGWVSQALAPNRPDMSQRTGSTCWLRDRSTSTGSQAVVRREVGSPGRPQAAPRDSDTDKPARGRSSRCRRQATTSPSVHRADRGTNGRPATHPNRVHGIDECRRATHRVPVPGVPAPRVPAPGVPAPSGVFVPARHPTPAMQLRSRRAPQCSRVRMQVEFSSSAPSRRRQSTRSARLERARGRQFRQCVAACLRAVTRRYAAANLLRARRSRRDRPMRSMRPDPTCQPYTTSVLRSTPPSRA
jgi:hypothetical protein